MSEQDHVIRNYGPPINPDETAYIADQIASKVIKAIASKVIKALDDPLKAPEAMWESIKLAIPFYPWHASFLIGVGAYGGRVEFIMNNETSLRIVFRNYADMVVGEFEIHP